MLFDLSKVLWALLRPSFLLLALACIGAALGRRWLMWMGLGGFLVVLVTPISQFALLPLEDRFPRPPLPPKIDSIIVLGGAVDPDLTEDRRVTTLTGAAERMTSLAALARQYPEARLVFTGGFGELIHGEVSEADVAESLFSSLGVPPSRITYERKSRNTWENALFTRRLVQPRPDQTWVLITSASHMPRAIGIFQRIGWPVLPWPVAYKSGHSPSVWYDAAFGERLSQLDLAAHEWIGLIAYRLLGRTSALFPSP
ncbi:MAG: YdcF family protein [Acetobacteraceae bacterium]|nr:YdcF family protein [Acetobacteraceae bacterium]